MVRPRKYSKPFSARTLPMKNVAVIIPYFQRKDGILRRTLTSILGQSLPPDTHIDIIIADDASPIPAETQTSGLTHSDQFSIRIIKKENGGVSSARNAGLDAVNDSTDYVAFIDSDDIWKETFLQKGILTLNAGYDLFFSDHARWGLYESHIATYCPSLATAPTIAGQNICEMTKEDLIDHILDSFPTKASTVLLRWEKIKNIRFETNIKSAGEDILYFAHVASKIDKACYSPEILVECADGINMFFSHYCEWDSPVRIAITYDRIKTYQCIRNIPDISPKNRDRADMSMKLFRQDFLFFSLRYMLKNKKTPPELIKAVKTPEFFLWLPTSAIALFIKKISGTYKPA